MLQTPFGKFTISINGQNTKFEAIELPYTEQGLYEHIFIVDGRYRIDINLEAFKDQDIIIEGILDVSAIDDIESGPSTGQHLAQITFWRNDSMLSVGFVGDIPHVTYEYLKDRVRINIPQRVALTQMLCNVAWLDMKNPEMEDHFTWFAADPTMFN